MTSAFCAICRSDRPFCHRCPREHGQIFQFCTAMTVSMTGTFTDCTCKHQLCYQCAAAADGRCIWPVELFLPKRVDLLQVGDECSNMKRTRQGHILQIADLNQQGVVMDHTMRVIVRRKRNKSGGDRRVDEYYWKKSDVVLTLQRVQCGQPGCFRHIRDLGDDRSFICAEHWPEQLRMIG